MDELSRFEIDLNAKCVCGCMEGDRIHKIYRFPNDYGASVVSGRKEPDGKMGRYRMFVLRFDSPPPEHCWEIARDTPITDDVLEAEDWDEIETILHRIIRLPRHECDGHCHSH